MDRPAFTSLDRVDDELSLIFDAILRRFILKWYAQITPDTTLIASIYASLAHCTRELEQRLRCIDLLTLLLNDIPCILDAHIIAYKRARAAAASSNHGLTTSQYPGSQTLQARLAYHTFNVHPALSPVPDTPDTAARLRHNLQLWSTLTSHASLILLLRPDDVQNPLLFSLLDSMCSSAFLDTLLINRFTTPHTIWQTLDQCFLQLSHTLHISSSVPRKSPSSTFHFPSYSFNLTYSGFFAVLRYWSIAFLYAVLTLSNYLYTAMLSFSNFCDYLDQVIRHTTQQKFSRDNSSPYHHRQPIHDSASSLPKRPPIVRLYIWSLLNHLFLISRRKPWLHGFTSLLHYLMLNGPACIQTFTRQLDYFAYAKLDGLINREVCALHLLQLIRQAVTKGEAKQKRSSTSYDSVCTRDQCARSIQTFLTTLANRYPTLLSFTLPPDDLLLADIQRILDIFSDQYMNKHLLVKLMDLLLVRLAPELEHNSIHQLLAQRCIRV